MAGEFGLVGGEEFRPGCEDMDREIMRASGQGPGQSVDHSHGCGLPALRRQPTTGVTHFAALGADAGQLMVLEKSQADDDAFIQSSQGTGVVYFTGGSPDHLLATLRDSQLLKYILDAMRGGAVIAGSSAGAMVMGSLMRRPTGGGWVEALGIVPGIAVLPHHERSDPAETSRQLRDQVPPELVVLGIDARTGCLGRPGNWRVVGSAKVTVLPGIRLAGLQLRQSFTV